MTHRVALRYAKPIFELAQEKNLVEEIRSDMYAILDICKKSKEFALFLQSPIISPQTKASILKKIFLGKVSELSLKLMLLLATKNRSFIIFDVANAFIHMYNEFKHLAVASITTAYKLDTSEENSFRDLVSKITSKNVILETKIDSSIIGGFKLFLEDWQIDQTIVNKLNKIKLNWIK